MPLLESRLKNAILSAMNTAESNALADTDPKDAYATAIAQAVVDEIKQATITIVATANGSPVVVTSVTIS